MKTPRRHCDPLAAAPYRSKSRNMYLGKFGSEFIIGTVFNALEIFVTEILIGKSFSPML